MLIAASDGGAGLGALIFLLIVACAYFAPTIVASARHHHNLGSIIVINLLLGWTFIGWVVALAMSLSATPPARA
jgi:hypothetical protein